MATSKGIVLSLCDYTGNHVGADICEWLPPYAPIAAVFAFPPCTDVAASGARWFKDKGIGNLIRALRLFEACLCIAEWTGAPYMIENPVSTISTYWRKPDYTFDPYEYGGYLNPPSDAYTKRTCLWTGNGFVMPKKRPIQPKGRSRMHRFGPSASRAALRSVTPKGFAQAVFEANEQPASKIHAERWARNCVCRVEEICRISRTLPRGLSGNPMRAGRDFVSPLQPSFAPKLQAI